MSPRSIIAANPGPPAAGANRADAGPRSLKQVRAEIRAEALALGARRATVEKWFRRGRIPAEWRIRLMDAGTARAVIDALSSPAVE